MDMIDQFYGLEGFMTLTQLPVGYEILFSTPDYEMVNRYPTLEDARADWYDMVEDERLFPKAQIIPFRKVA